MNVQNALERRDMGAGTGALLVLRSLGNAFGGALPGTLLTLEFRRAGRGRTASRTGHGRAAPRQQALAQLRRPCATRSAREWPPDST